MPDDDLRFFGLSDGPTKIMCVELRRIGNSWQVVASGKNRHFVVTQMVKWLRSVAPDYVRPLNATIHRPADPGGPTLSGPRHPAETYPCQIKLGYPAFIKVGSSSITV